MPLTCACAIKQKSQTLQRFGPIRQHDGIERQPSSFPLRIRLVIGLITCEEQKADPGWDFERVVIIRRSEKVSTQKNDFANLERNPEAGDGFFAFPSPENPAGWHSLRINRDTFVVHRTRLRAEKKALASIVNSL